MPELFAGGRRIRPARRGNGFDVRLPGAERDVLRGLPGQLRELLEDPDPADPAVARLYPAAYPDDPIRSAEYEELVRQDLTARRLRSAEEMLATIDAERLSEGQLLSWLATVNDLRLVLGTRLEVTEETDLHATPADDPRAPLIGVYLLLTWLEEDMVEALGG